MNESRLRQVIRAFDVWRERDDIPPDAKSRARWSATAEGWTLQVDGAGWTFEAISMDGCVELFAAKMREICVNDVLAIRRRLDLSTQALAIVDELLGVPAANQQGERR